MNPVLVPLAAAQGARVRRRTVRLPPAAGPTRSAAASTSASLGLAVVGESTAAGCGAATHDEAFAGRLAHHLAAATGREVAWEVHGRSGATLDRIGSELVPALPAGTDATVLLVGVNDVLRGTGAEEWRRRLVTVLPELRRRTRHVVLAGLPPFDAFPALPRPLSRLLQERGDRLDAVSRLLCSTEPRTTWVPTSDVPVDDDFFAADGFHPSAHGYDVWARQVARRLAGRLVPDLDP